MERRGPFSLTPNVCMSNTGPLCRQARCSCTYIGVNMQTSNLNWLFFYHSSPRCQKSLFSRCFHKRKAAKNLRINGHTWLGVICASCCMCGQSFQFVFLVLVKTSSNFDCDFYTSLRSIFEADSDKDIFHTWLSCRLPTVLWRWTLCGCLPLLQNLSWHSTNTELPSG